MEPAVETVAIRVGLSGLYLVASYAAAAAALSILRRRETTAALWFGGVVLAASWWSLFDAIELHIMTPGGKQWLTAVQYLGVVSAPPCFLQAALALARPDRPLTRPQRLFVWAIPLLALAAAWTNSLHHGLWQHISVDPLRAVTGVYHYGMFLWVFTGHAYLLLAVSTWLLIEAARGVTQPFRIPVWVTVMAVAVPWAGSALHIWKLGPAALHGIDWAGLGIVVSGTLLAWAIGERGLVDALPHARELLADCLPQGVLVIDRDAEVRFANGAAREMIWSGDKVGRVPLELLVDGELQLGQHWLDVHAIELRDRWDRIAGQLVVFEDISARKRLELERRSLIGELTQALARVRNLESMLPICSQCHRIRSEQGEWTRLDHYISSRTDVQFSHGLCPTCLRELYGDDPELVTGLAGAARR